MLYIGITYCEEKDEIVILDTRRVIREASKIKLGKTIQIIFESEEPENCSIYVTILGRLEVSHWNSYLVHASHPLQMLIIKDDITEVD